MQQYLQNKEGLVENVFNKVYDKYDLMNDFMSLGIHRIWKKNLLNWMNPSSNKILADVACGTGDIGKLYLDFTNKDNKIFCIDPNRNMIEKGRNKLKKYKNIKWMVNSAEKLSLKENSCDYYAISFGGGPGTAYRWDGKFDHGGAFEQGDTVEDLARRAGRLSHNLGLIKPGSGYDVRLDTGRR